MVVYRYNDIARYKNSFVHEVVKLVLLLLIKNVNILLTLLRFVINIISKFQNEVNYIISE